MAGCPHCSKEIDALEGFVPQAKLEERLKGLREAKDGEIKALQAAVGELRPKATEFEKVKAELDKATGELTRVRTVAERSKALREAGLGDDLLPALEALHTSAVADVAEAERVDFEAWLAGPAREHVLLAPHFAGGGQGRAAGAAAGQAQAPGAGQTRVPPDTGAGAPTTSGRMSPEQLAAYYQGPQFQALKPEEKRAVLAEHRTTYGA